MIARMLILITCLLGTDVSAAVTAADETLQFFEEEAQVITASRLPQSIRRAPGTVRVITEREIKERGYKDLKDIFRDLPGFDVSENVSGEARTLAIARGLIGENKLMVLRDGKKLNAATGERLILGDNMPLFDVKRIEIIYGPLSAMYGPDAYSGVVNIITKDIADIGKNGAIDVSYGAWNTRDTGLLLGKKINDDISLYGSGRFYRSGGFDLSRDYRTYASKTYAQPIRDYNIDFRLRLKDLTLSWYRSDAREPGGPNTTASWFRFDGTYIWRQTQNFLSLDHKLAGGSYALNSTLRYEDMRIQPDTNFYYDPAGPFPDNGHQYKFGENNAAKLSQQLNLSPDERVDIVSGYELEAVRAFPKGNNLSSPYDRADLVDTIYYPATTDVCGSGSCHGDELPADLQGSTVSYGVRPSYNWGAYTEITYRPNASMQANLGARYDHSTDYNGFFTPRCGFIWDLTGTTNLKLLFSKAVIKPSPYQALEHWTGGSFGVYPNEDLRPEKLTHYGANLEQVLADDRIRLGLNTFYNQITDLITPIGTNWQQNRNVGSPFTYGFELTLDALVAVDLKAYAYYSRLTAKQDGGERDLNKVAEHKGNLGLTYTTGKLSISPRARLSSGVAKLTTSQGAVERLPGFGVFDCSARYEAGKNISFYATGRNLLDKKYYTATPFGEGPSGWQMPEAAQPGFFVEMGTTLKF